MRNNSKTSKTQPTFTVSLFRDFKPNEKKAPLNKIIEVIRNGKLKEPIEKIRSLKRGGNSQSATKEKNALLAFTPSGIFKGSRKADNLIKYSGLVHLDFDKIESGLLTEKRNLIESDEYTHSCFLSPSGNGFKVFIKINTDPKYHNIAYEQVRKYFEEILGIPADPSCKDITRLCFLSHDPKAYLKENSKVFEVQINKDSHKSAKSILSFEKPTDPNSTNENLDDSELEMVFQKCINLTEKKDNYEEGNRNNYIYLLACNLNRYGIDQGFAIENIVSSYEHEDSSELKKTIESAYKNHLDEFASLSFTETKDMPEPPKDYAHSTPKISQSLIDKLPEILKNGAKVFTNERERDVFITAMWPVLGGCFSNVFGVYRGEKVFITINTFVIAPAASGKGVMKHAKAVAEEYHSDLIKTSESERQKYEQALASYNKQLNDPQSNGQKLQKPVEPPNKRLFIPGNTSFAMLFDLLYQNEGEGIIFETEADAMGKAIKQDWGDYSELFRSSFHHEKVSIARKTNNKITEILNPRINFGISGTPSQIANIVNSAEDGLFSRILFYIFKGDSEWEDVSPQANQINYNDYFASLGKQILLYVKFIQKYPMEVKLHQSEWEEINKFGKSYLSHVKIFVSENATSIVYRMGLMLYRLCMILTTLRKCEKKDKSNIVYCTKEDFQTALGIIKVYFKHTVLMYNNLAKKEDAQSFDLPNHKQNLLKKLPNTFKRTHAITIGKKLGMSVRSIDLFLKQATGKYLMKIKTGNYKKVKKRRQEPIPNSNLQDDLTYEENGSNKIIQDSQLDTIIPEYGFDPENLLSEKEESHPIE